MTEPEINKINLMNCIDGLRLMKPKSVNTCVSSPPYYALRDYGIEPTKFPAITYSLFGFKVKVKAQTVCLGLELTPQDFIGHLVHIYRLVRETLADDGTCWVNIGDSYSAQKTGNSTVKSTLSGGLKNQVESGKRPNNTVKLNSIKPKDMLGIPWMLAFALREDGWFLRQDIIWHKTNCMPESCNDRCTKNHEYIFLLSKNNRYYFDQTAIMTPVSESTVQRLNQDIENQIGSARANGGKKHNGNLKAQGGRRLPSGWDKRAATLDSHTRSPRPFDNRGGNQGNGDIPAIGKGNRKTFRGGGAYTNNSTFDNSTDAVNDSVGNTPNITGFANKRSVWTVATYGFKEAHFATFPPNLITDCIKAGCPQGGLVLDMFMGSGTTAIVASKLHRNFIGFEQNPKYLKIAERRLAKELGLFNPIHD